MSKSRFEKGTSVRVTVTYRNSETSALEDPSTVTVAVRKPDATLTAPTPTNPSVGVWQVIVPTDQEGTWYARFTATGPAKVDTVPFDIYQEPDF